MPIVNAVGRHRRDEGCHRRIEALEMLGKGRAKNSIGEAL
jgi:hypothetical protein